ncbi:MAG: DEAD/DEAH box helicase family protein [Firmicutes bacterium]|nr:DEAD/DEAH box helicase family protein [Bacillota bacterium]
MAVYYLYTVESSKGKISAFTHDPFLDAAYWANSASSRIFVLNAPLRIDVAKAVTDTLKDPPTRVGISFFRRLTAPTWLDAWRQKIKKELHRQNANSPHLDIKAVESKNAHLRTIPEDFLALTAAVLKGRLLTFDEVQSAAFKITAKSPYPLRDMLQVLAIEGRIGVDAAITSPLKSYHTCTRCGTSLQLETVDCPLCGRSDCRICPNCRTLGEMRSCRELYMGLEPSGDQRQTARHNAGITDNRYANTCTALRPGNQAFPGLKAQFPFQLTLSQARASQKLGGHVQIWLEEYLQNAETVQENSLKCTPKDCLIWAVCGAGKTEIAFKAVELALQKGLRVLFAIPRRDVVLELLERAKSAFPNIPIDALYGGVKAPPELSALVLATTHQLLRFNSCFDLAILDEADAFPYAGSPMLHYAFNRSVKPEGLKIYMTATPSPAMLGKARRGELELVTVPVRHHGHPVPIPTLLEDKGYRLPARPMPRTSKATALMPGSKNGPITLPEEFWELLLESIQAGSRIFIFVPRIWLVSILVKVIAVKLRSSAGVHGDTLTKIPIFGTHSQDREAEAKRLAFQAHAPAVIVSTSVLERGVTAAKADVFVLYAHDELFDAPTLIQMAGRSGRTAKHPTGRVWFMADNATAEIDWAVESIREINASARRQGLLKGIRAQT